MPNKDIHTSGTTWASLDTVRETTYATLVLVGHRELENGDSKPYNKEVYDRQ
jgi:hypothetical protein